MRELRHGSERRVKSKSVAGAPAILLAAAAFLIALVPTPTMGQAEPSLQVREQCGDTHAVGGEIATLHVDFSSGGSQVGGFRLAIEFAPGALSLPNGENDIRLGPALVGLGGGALFKEVNNSEGKILLFYPISLPPLPEIPDGTVLEIDVQVKAGAAVGCSLLACTQVEFSGLDGKKLLGGTCSGGGVTIEPPMCGNNSVDPGEDCDPPTQPDGCCTNECRFAPEATACGDDGNVCTDDQCDANGVCGHIANTAPCDDGLFCNGVDTCGGGSCSVHSGDPCAGGNECDTTCNENTDTCFDPIGTACTDDGNVCTDDKCDGQGNCTHANNSASCDDGLFCNGTDTCSGGQCAHSGNPCPGPDGDGNCAESCDEQKDGCNAPDPGGSTCNDGDTCTLTDQCDGAGSCVGGGTTCGNGAVESECGEQCDPPTGQGGCCTTLCTYAGGGTECRAKVGECDAAESCTGLSAECPPDRFAPEGTGCTDDGDICTSDVCDGAGTCSHPPVAAVCGDGCVSFPEECDPPGSTSQCPRQALCLDGCVCEYTAEACGNGVDDDGDLLVDGEDPDCQAKVILRCQKGIEIAGRAFVDAVLRRTSTCVDKMIRAQLAGERDGDPGALADFREGMDRCDRELGKIFDPRKGAERAKRDKVRKECGPLGDVEVLFRSPQGLGFDLLRDTCLAEHGIELRTLDDIIDCIDEELGEFGATLASVLGPRTCELFDKARGLPREPEDRRGRRPGTFEDETEEYLDSAEGGFICLSELPTVAEPSEVPTRQLARCHAGLAKAGRTAFRAMVRRLLRCVDALLAAELTAEVGKDPGDKFEKALDRCDAEIGKLLVGDKSAMASLGKSVRKACKKKGRALTDSELIDTTGGLGFEALGGVCQTKYGVQINGIDDIIDCIAHEARWYALRITSKLKPRACEMIERALGTPPCPSPDERKKCLDDVTRQLLTELEADLICNKGPKLRLAFSSTRDRNQQIYSMLSDGGYQVRLSGNLTDDGYPRWSPDCRQISFASNRDGNWEVYLMEADGSNQRNLTTHPGGDGYMDWAPDGQLIVFASDRTGNLDLYTVQPDGSQLTRLTTDLAIDVHPAYSPDGRKIAFASDRDGDREIYVMDSEDSSSIMQLTNNFFYDDYPAWSPDGSKLAFASDRDSHDSSRLDIYIMSINGASVVRLTDNPADDRHPAWAPSSMIAFASDRAGNAEIYSVAPDGSRLTRLTTAAGEDGHPDWCSR